MTKARVLEAANPVFVKTRTRVRKECVWLFGLSVFINLLVFTQPLYMFQVFDRVVGSGNISTLIYLTVIAGIAFLALAALTELRSRILGRLSTWLAQALGPSILRASGATTIIGRSVGMQGFHDLRTIRSFMQSQAAQGLLDAPAIPLFIIVMFLMHPILGAMTLGGALVLLGLAVLAELRARDAVAMHAKAQTAADRMAETHIINAEVARAMGMDAALAERWNTINAKAIAAANRVNERTGGFLAISRFVRLFLQVAVLGVGAYLLLQGHLTIGGVIAASILLGRALAPIDHLISGWKLLIAARNAEASLDKILRFDKPTPVQIELPAPSGRLDVEAVTYVPPDADKPVLSGISFSLEAGDACAIIGPSSAGKSTLCKLINGVIKPSSGLVRIDGADAYDWQNQGLGPHIGYLPQDVELFDGTIAENIARMGKPDSDDVIAAASLADLHETILRFPSGYHTRIGPFGRNLSGGIRQRIGLARALYREPQIVTLDEPNAHLDHVGEAALLKVLDTLRRRGVTLLIVSHTRKILQACNKTLVLDGGRVRHFGGINEIMGALPAPKGHTQGTSGGSPSSGIS